MNISKGRIAVYNERHKLLHWKIYYTSEGMKKAMAELLVEPGANYIQVRPYEPNEKVIYRLPVKHDAYLSDEVKAPIVRPPAVYSNPRYV